MCGACQSYCGEPPYLNERSPSVGVGSGLEGRTDGGEEGENRARKGRSRGG